jgi:hypothetical protein
MSGTGSANRRTRETLLLEIFSASVTEPLIVPHVMGLTPRSGDQG